VQFKDKGSVWEAWPARYFRGEFVTSSREEFGCDDPDCGITSNLKIVCAVCKLRGFSRHFHELETFRNHFETFQAQDEEHLRCSPFRELSLQELGNILSLTIKQDQTSKLITFLVMLLAQTRDDACNVTFSGASSTGKSYIPLEISNYFPREEVVAYSAASPTSFFHELGKLVIKTSDNRLVALEEFLQPLLEELEDEKSKERQNRDNLKMKELEHQIRTVRSRAKILVDFENKILIFMDQPHFQLLERMRSFLSHDKKIIEIPITDKSGHGGNRTKHVLLRGFACVFFCTVRSDLDDQESTRVFILSPESSQSKINEALRLLDLKLSNRDLFVEKLLENVDRASLVMRVELIRLTGVDRIICDEGIVLKRFEISHQQQQAEGYKPRALRDFVRVYALVYAHALLNCFNREHVDDYVIRASTKDVEAAFALYEPILRANEAGISPELDSLFYEVIVPGYLEKNMERAAKKEGGQGKLGVYEEITGKWIGLSYLEIAKKFHEVNKRQISYQRVREDVKSLVLAGLLVEETDPYDKRKPIFTPILRVEALANEAKQKQ
jgi:hypothetical protein